VRLGVLGKTDKLMTVGSGRESFTADIPIMKIRGVVVIPGSTFKGVLRRSAMKVSPLLNIKNCFDFGLTFPCATTRSGGVCPVCKVFGLSGEDTSPLQVTDLRYVKSEEDALRLWRERMLVPLGDENPTITRLVRIRVDDSTQTSAEGALFESEALPPGTLFYGEIRLSRALLKKAGVDVNEASRLVLAALADLSYERIGRGGLMTFKVVGSEGIPEDEESKMLLDMLVKRW